MNQLANRQNPVAEVCTALTSEAMQSKFKAALPAGVSLDRFTRVALMAIQQNPGVITNDRASLYNACVKCAADGLLPDGREAALVTFGQAVQYMPMIGGIIKRLAQSNITIDTQLVYTNDEFEQLLGDDARIIHKAPPLGQPRGEIVGVYAIARLPNGLIMREVMDKDQVDQVRNVSRSKSSGPWVSWYGEMARKTVARRLAKRLPITDPTVAELLTRDDEMYNLDPMPEQSSVAERVNQAVTGAAAPPAREMDEGEAVVTETF